MDIQGSILWFISPNLRPVCCTLLYAQFCPQTGHCSGSTPLDTVSPPLSLFGGAFGTPQAVPRPPARGQTVAGVRRSPIPGLSVTRVGHSPARWMSRTVRRLQSDFRPGFSRAHGTPNNKTDSTRTAGLAAVFANLFTKMWSSDHPNLSRGIPQGHIHQKIY